MNVRAPHWGVPRTDSTVVRTRLIDRLARNARNNTVLVAPSGYGKTVAVAQYARSLSAPVLWLSMDGSVLDCSLLFRQLARLVGAFGGSGDCHAAEEPLLMDLAESARSSIAALDSQPVLLVLDGCCTAMDRPLGGTVSSVLGSLAPFVHRVIVTARELSQEDMVSLHGWDIVEKGDFIFDEAEARLLALSLGISNPDDGAVRDSVDAAGGHAALLSIMLASRDAQVAERSVEPSVAAIAVIEQLIDAHLSDDEREVLELASLLGESTAQDLETAGNRHAADAIKRIGRLLPLVRAVESDPDGGVIFVVHDLVSACLLHQIGSVEGRSRAHQVDSVLRVLATRGSWTRAREVLANVCDEDAALHFVEIHGQFMLSALRHEDVLRIIGLVSLQQTMRSPRVLSYWSNALHEAGKMSESLAKANAALTLAEHERDYATLGLAATSKVNTLIDQGKDQEAIECAERYLGGASARMPTRIRCDLILSYAGALAGTLRQEEALEALNRAARETEENDSRYLVIRGRLERLRILLETLWTGDWEYAARRIAPLLNDSDDTYYVRQTLRGNLGVALVELGRLSRAESLLRLVTNRGHALLDAAYLPTLGLIAAARGDYTDSLRLIASGRRAAVECGDDADIHVSLVYQSVIERAAGMHDAALETAERSFESLSHRDMYSYSTLAAIECGASLLALGDTVSARRWVGAPPTPGQVVIGNRYYALCGAMVLSVCEHRDGDTAAAIDLLRPFAPYIQSESANWRMAMYCRTFPELLGLLSGAAGPERLPVHMLRMLLPENAERCLRECRSFLPDPEWQALGRRALGDDQFAEYLERKGRPICRVRLFGGLEVSVDDRSLSERDWKKRKARLLFAMLVVRRGQDIPRDQILEHLWPDLDESKARNNFYVAWSTMKSALMDPEQRDAKCPYVESSRGRCRIVRDAVRSDVDDFEELVALSREAEASGDAEGAVRALNELMSVYRGDLLPGDVYDDWFSTLRDKYRLEFVDAMLRAVELLLEQDDPCEALLFARQGFSAEPHREDLYQAALRCHILAGQRSSAIETFIQCKTRMAEDLGLDPSAETLALYQRVLGMEERPRYDSYGLTAD